MRANSILEIDIDIIKDNYAILKQLSIAEVAAMVKADAYGLGATQIAKALKSVGCNKFFVADIKEALELRKTIKFGIIFVLCGIEQGDEEYFIHNNIYPVINHLGQLEVLNKFCRVNNIKYKASLHIDSGMNRLGMEEREVIFLQSNPELKSHIFFEYVMSHLASSEETDNEFNRIQLDKFNLLRKDFKNSKASIANSGGILLGKEYHLDLVRPGAAIYGLNSNKNVNIFRNPMRLFTKIVQIKRAKAGESLGYNQTYIFEKDSIIGTIPLGYADGIFRSLSNNGHCYINNIAVPIIGRVSMDLLNIDLTNAPDEFRKIGQEIDIISNNQTPDMLAKNANTIGYEIITSFGNRYERKYLNTNAVRDNETINYEVLKSVLEKDKKKYLSDENYAS